MSSFPGCIFKSEITRVLAITFSCLWDNSCGFLKWWNQFALRDQLQERSLFLVPVKGWHCWILRLCQSFEHKTVLRCCLNVYLPGYQGGWGSFTLNVSFGFFPGRNYLLFLLLLSLNRTFTHFFTTSSPFVFFSLDMFNCFAIYLYK